MLQVRKTNYLKAITPIKGFGKWLANWVNVPRWDNSFSGLWQYDLTNIDGSCRDYEKIIRQLGLNGFKKSKSQKSAEVKITIDWKTFTGTLTEQ